MKNKLLLNLLRCFLLMAVMPIGLNAQHTISIHPAIKGKFFPPFEICIPENFTFALQQPDPKTMDLFCEFIPQGEKINNWSEIITVQKMRTSIGMPYFLNLLKSEFDNSANKSSILRSEVSIHREEEMLTGIYIFDGPYSSPMTNFVNSQTENEIVIIKAASAKDGSLWIVQYAIKYPKNLSSGGKATVVEKLWAFANSCKALKENYK